LNLARLGGLGAEAVDECAQVRDARLLVRLLALLLRLPLGALQLAGRISAGVADQALVFERQRACAMRFQEVASWETAMTVPGYRVSQRSNQVASRSR
jgi:hypothetical protein